MKNHVTSIKLPSAISSLNAIKWLLFVFNVVIPAIFSFIVGITALAKTTDQFLYVLLSMLLIPFIGFLCWLVLSAFLDWMSQMLFMLYKATTFIEKICFYRIDEVPMIENMEYNSAICANNLQRITGTDQQ